MLKRSVFIIENEHKVSLLLNRQLNNNNNN